MMKTITIKNNFHGTEYGLKVSDYGVPLSPGQIRRCRKALCGIKNCICGGVVGERGPQEIEITYYGTYEICLLRKTCDLCGHELPQGTLGNVCPENCSEEGATL